MDGGQTWVEHGDDGGGNNRSKHLHSDLHAVYFDPTDSTGQRLFVGSDGGVAMTPDLGQNFQSNFNRQLCNLQFDSGTLSANYLLSGLVGGGLQDNEDVYCLMGQNLTPWKEINVGGDGSVTLFIATGQLVGQLVYNDNRKAWVFGLANWNGNNFQGFAIIPITVPKPNAQPDFSGVQGPAVAEIVISPAFRNGARQLMYAVTSGSRPDSPDVYGLFGDENGNNMHWEYIGSVSSPVYALGSFNGDTVFVGTKDGRIFALEPSGSVLELNVPIRNSKKGAIHDLLVPSDRQAFATFNTDSEGFVLRLDFLVGWEALSGGLPKETFSALETDWTANPKTIFAATDSGVYVSPDNGDTWQSASQGLPKRPHCADLRFVTQSSGEHYLYLSTYGRSVWQARLN
jgi:putative pyrroloquinoline-quinone-binding quinoprotein